MKELTNSVYTFENLIEGNFLYVDKTEYIYRLLQSSQSMFFYAHPRRFGKSLTISTLEAVFMGKKELFTGLAIEKKPYDWKIHPVIHLDFGDIKCNDADTLENNLQEHLAEIAQQYNIKLTRENAQGQFREMILALTPNDEKIVILIDEYDKPILSNILDPECNNILKVLKGFYSVIKGTESRQRFVFLTGVSKFSHVSVFSDLNNLFDISMHVDYATMLGYTQEELESNFSEHIDYACKAQNTNREELLKQMKIWYNGYRFEETSATVYNPASIAMFFKNYGKFNNYWFSTGTPTFLLELMKTKDYNLENIINEPVESISFSAYEVDNLSPLPLLFQTGYLTIKSATRDFGTTLYYLDFPNLEVKSAFETYLLNTYTRIDKTTVNSIALELARSVRSGDVNRFMEILTSFFAQIPYDIHVKHEKYYQTVFYVLFLLVGVHIESESRTNKGRIDAVVSYGDYTYLFEFKLDGNSELALEQITEREYYQKYQGKNRKIHLVGANFDSSTGQITDYLTQEL